MRLSYARRKRQLSQEQLVELEEIARGAIQRLPEVEQDPDPQDPFDGDADNRLHQDVPMPTEW